MTDIPTLGRPESFRLAYQAALHDLAQMTAERDTARDELDAARSEILILRARLGNINDLTAMAMPEDWRKKEG